MSGDLIYGIGVIVLYITLLVIAFAQRKEIEDRWAVAIIITLISAVSWAGIVVLITLQILSIGERDDKK